MVSPLHWNHTLYTNDFILIISNLTKHRWNALHLFFTNFMIHFTKNMSFSLINNIIIMSDLRIFRMGIVMVQWIKFTEFEVRFIRWINFGCINVFAVMNKLENNYLLDLFWKVFDVLSQEFYHFCCERE